MDFRILALICLCISFFIYALAGVAIFIASIFSSDD